MSGDCTFSEFRADAIKIITDAARLRGADGYQHDMAEFIAHAASSAAANLGGAEALLAGRSGSWEADYVRQLIEGTIGDDPVAWQSYRTEPMTASSNVAELIELSLHHPGLLVLDDAIDATYDALPTHFGAPDLDTRIQAAMADLEQHYAEEYRSYGDRFSEVVRGLGEDLGLPPVVVKIDADPRSAWWDESALHSPDLSSDPIVDSLWQHAHDVTALPNIYVRTVSSTTSVTVVAGDTLREG